MKRAFRHVLATFLMIAMVLTGCGSPSELPYSQVDAHEAQIMMEESEDYVILDVRTPEEYAENHIVGAINVPNETIGDDALAELPDKKQQIFVYCRSGNRSKQASEKLAELGYGNIVEFGGIKDWDGPTTSSQ